MTNKTVLISKSWRNLCFEEPYDPTDLNKAFLSSSAEGISLRLHDLGKKGSKGNDLFAIEHPDGGWLCAELTKVDNPSNEKGVIKMKQQIIENLKSSLVETILKVDEDAPEALAELFSDYLYGNCLSEVYTLPGKKPSKRCEWFFSNESGSNKGVWNEHLKMCLRCPSWQTNGTLMLQTHCNGDEYFNVNIKTVEEN